MIELNEQIIFLGDGTEGDLEYKLYEYMIWLAKSEEYDVTDEGKWIPIGPWFWEHGEPDFEVSSWWCEK
ncbi:hypothetical protein T73t3_83 [Escherichia phage T4]|nr:hypothetical protein T73t3_83 [Escherichia phage T4]